MRFPPCRACPLRPAAAIAAVLGVLLTTPPGVAGLASPGAHVPADALRALATTTCEPAWLAALQPRSLRPQEALGFAPLAAGDRTRLQPPAGTPRVYGVAGDEVAADEVLSRGDGATLDADRVARRAAARASDLDAADVAQGSVSTKPNDEYFDFQSDSLGQVLHVFDAWQVSYGRDDVTIAVISDGVDLGHPDLGAKIWRNPDETADNGRDDDGNGYVDDVQGWDFGRDWNAPTKGDNEPQPLYFEPRTVARSLNRGTQMAGIAAAQTNNGEGIAGVSWGARIMPIKATFAAKDPDTDRWGAAFWIKSITEGVCYAAKNEATVILIGGLPLGELIPDEVRYESVKRLSEAIAFAGTKGIPVIAPAGECGFVERVDQVQGCPKGANPDIWPARTNSSNVIGVTATHVDEDGYKYARRRTMSTGPWVDIAAPGEGFYTTINRVPGGTDDEHEIEQPYQMIAPFRLLFAPDDFAAAHIAGVAAVMKTINPTLSPLQVKEHLCRGAHRDETLGEFEVGDDDWLRNDAYGCGVVDFERTVEQMPRKIRLDGGRAIHSFVPLGEPEIQRYIVNPYLNVDAWAIYTETTWLEEEARSQRRGEASVRGLVINIENLDRWANGLSSSSVIAPQEVRVCPTNDPDLPRALKFNQEDCGLAARTGCACLQLRVHVADHVSRIYLPRGLRYADPAIH